MRIFCVVCDVRMVREVADFFRVYVALTGSDNGEDVPREVVREAVDMDENYVAGAEAVGFCFAVAWVGIHDWLFVGLLHRFRVHVPALRAELRASAFVVRVIG